MRRLVEQQSRGIGRAIGLVDNRQHFVRRGCASTSLAETIWVHKFGSLWRWKALCRLARPRIADLRRARSSRRDDTRDAQHGDGLLRHMRAIWTRARLAFWALARHFSSSGSLTNGSGRSCRSSSLQLWRMSTSPTRAVGVRPSLKRVSVNLGSAHSMIAASPSRVSMTSSGLERQVCRAIGMVSRNLPRSRGGAKGPWASGHSDGACRPGRAAVFFWGTRATRTASHLLQGAPRTRIRPDSRTD